jgi:lipopolysaccharide/colanic/teichoic acid biosynthesis glycosyltransferase
MSKICLIQPNADLEREMLIRLTLRQNPLFKIQDDPRITEVGRTPCRWSLGDVPQLFNPFVGLVGCIGPRPPPLAGASGYELKIFDGWNFSRAWPDPDR